MVNGHMRTSILDTRVMRGADVYSDHYLLRTRIRLKLARVEGMKKARVGFDVRKLQSKEIRKKYNIEVKNRFEALGDIEDPEEEHNMSKPWIGDKHGKKLRRGKRQNLRWKAQDQNV